MKILFCLLLSCLGTLAQPTLLPIYYGTVGNDSAGETLFILWGKTSTNFNRLAAFLGTNIVNIGAGTNIVLTTNGTQVVINSTASGSGGSAPVGTVVNSGASTASQVPAYTDTTGTNVAPRTVTGTGNILAASTIGSSVEAWDADLDALAGLSGTGIVKKTGAGAFSLSTSAADLSNGTTGSGAVVLASGSTVTNALLAGTFTGALTNAGRILETVRDVPTSTWDASTGHWFTKTISTSTTLAVTGIPIGGWASLTVTNTDTSSNYLLFTGVDHWENGAAPNQRAGVAIYQFENKEGVVRGVWTEAPIYAGAGSLLYSTNTTQLAELPIGPSGYQLTVNTALPAKMEWAAPVSTAGFMATSSGSATGATLAVTTTFKGSGGETIGLFQDDGLYISSTTAAGATKRLQIKPNATTVDFDVQNGGGNTDINLFSGGRSVIWKNSSSVGPQITATTDLGTASVGYRRLFIDTGTAVGNFPFLVSKETWNNAGVTFHGGTMTITDTASAAASTFAEYYAGASGTTLEASIRKDGAIFSAALTPSRIAVIDSSGFLSGGIDPTVLISDTAYGAGWDGKSTNAVSQNAAYDRMVLLATLASPAFTTGWSLDSILSAATSSTNATLTASASRQLSLGAGGTNNLWVVGATSGGFFAGTDNVFDIGGTANGRPKTITAGTSVVSPVFTTPTGDVQTQINNRYNFIDMCGGGGGGSFAASATYFFGRDWIGTISNYLIETNNQVRIDVAGTIISVTSHVRQTAGTNGVDTLSLNLNNAASSTAIGTLPNDNLNGETTTAISVAVVPGDRVSIKNVTGAGLVPGTARRFWFTLKIQPN